MPQVPDPRSFFSPPPSRTLASLPTDVVRRTPHTPHGDRTATRYCATPFLAPFRSFFVVFHAGILALILCELSSSGTSCSRSLFFGLSNKWMFEHRVPDPPTPQQAGSAFFKAPPVVLNSPFLKGFRFQRCGGQFGYSDKDHRPVRRLRGYPRPPSL